MMERIRFIGLTLAMVFVLASQAATVAAAEAADEAAPAEPAADQGADVAAPTETPRIAPPPEEPFSIEAVVEDLKLKFEAGGTTMWIILFLSVLGLAFVLERGVRLRRGVIAPAGLAEQADRLWQQGRLDEIDALCGRHPRATLVKIIRFAIRHRTSPVGEVSAAAGDIAARDIGRHTMLTYPLMAVAALSPLLGLFGTVLGMMESFETVALAGEMGDPSLLASGISKALVTTAFGLFVAIPTLFFYHLFKLRTNFLASVLEEEASSLISSWFMKKETADAD